MTIRNTIGLKERILAFGPAGVGKSKLGFDVYQHLPASSTVVFIDNDDTFDRLYRTWKGEPFKCTFEPHPLEKMDYEGHLVLLESLTKRCRAGELSEEDFIHLDMLTPLWDAAQNYYTDGIYGKDLSDYFMAYKKREVAGQGNKSGNALEGDKDWTTINKVYAKIPEEILKCSSLTNIICTAEADVVGKEGREDRDNIKLYSGYGVKPKGQKRMSHMFHSIFLLSKTRDKRYQYTTVKDRGREEYEDEDWEDWGLEYMVERAGWSVEVPKVAAARKKGTTA